jgi:large subunit ribosomal protein L15
MIKLNELANREGSTKNRMRVGRGPGSGKGKTAGRGVKGQKSRSGVSIAGFEGGQMPLHMRLPKRGFRNPFAKKLVEVNLWRLAQAIEAGKLDAKKPIDGKALIAAGVIRRERDGIRLLGNDPIKGKLDITAHSATASALKIVEDAGGKVTLTAKAKAEPTAKRLSRSKNKNRAANDEAKAAKGAAKAKAAADAAAASAAPEAPAES